MDQLKEENHRLLQVNKNLTGLIAIMEMERASTILRLQNIPKDKEDDQPELITTILADALATEKEVLDNEMDQIYRVNSSYASRRNVVAL